MLKFLSNGRAFKGNRINKRNVRRYLANHGNKLYSKFPPVFTPSNKGSPACVITLRDSLIPIGPNKTKLVPRTRQKKTQVTNPSRMLFGWFSLHKTNQTTPFSGSWPRVLLGTVFKKIHLDPPGIQRLRFQKTQAANWFSCSI